MPRFLGFAFSLYTATALIAQGPGLQTPTGGGAGSAAGSIGCHPSPNFSTRFIAAGLLPPIQIGGRLGRGRKTNDGNFTIGPS